jgi:hypothetical protein
VRIVEEIRNGSGGESLKIDDELGLGTEGQRSGVWDGQWVLNAGKLCILVRNTENFVFV